MLKKNFGVAIVAVFAMALAGSCGDDDDEGGATATVPRPGTAAVQTSTQAAGTSAVGATTPAVGTAVATIPGAGSATRPPGTAIAPTAAPAPGTAAATATAPVSGTALATMTAPGTSVRPLKDVLADAINEEYKARATYQAVIDKFGAVAPFANIINAEASHIEAWVRLFNANSLAVPADSFAGKVSAPVDLKAACQAGVAAEREDAALYDKLMKETTDPEALKVMAQQRTVSLENHLPAFEKCAQ